MKCSAKRRVEYAPHELQKIRACVDSKASLRNLAHKLGRNYNTLWKFVNQRGGVKLRAKRATKNEVLKDKIIAAYNKIYASRRIRHPTSVQIAKTVKCDRRVVAAVLRKQLKVRKNSVFPSPIARKAR